MAKKLRGPQKFQTGETVFVLSPIHRQLNGKRGVISNVEQSSHANTLDKYTVRIEDSALEGVFWDLELTRTIQTTENSHGQLTK